MSKQKKASRWNVPTVRALRASFVLLVIMAVALLLRPPTAQHSWRSINTFDELLGSLSRKYTVVESHRAGPLTVVYFTDKHLPEYEKQTLQRIAELEEAYDLEICGVEHWVEGPGSARDRALRQRVEMAVTPDPKDVFETPEGAKGGRPMPTLPHSEMFAALFESRGFKTVGLEDERTLEGILPAALGEEIYDHLLTATMESGYVPVRVRGKYLPTFAVLKKLEAHLNRTAPGYPILDPDRLKENDAKLELQLIGPQDREYVGELALMHRNWLIRHACLPRNKIAAEKLVADMKANGYTRGAIVFGHQHSVTDTLVPGPTIQDHLKRMDVSYIVVSYAAK